MRVMRRWVTAAGALVLLVALLIGVPVVLIALAGWPLPTSMPDWEHVWTMMRQGEIPADAVIKGIAVVVWVAWLQLAWAVVWELAVNVRRTGDGRRHRPAPLVAGPVSGGVGRLFAAIMAVGALVATSGSASAGLPTPSASVTLDVSTTETRIPESTHAVASAPAADQLPCWVVGGGDTMWSIAESTLGDGTRVGEIVALNPLVSPRHLREGHVLTLPAGAQVPTDRVPAAAPVIEPELDDDDDEGTMMIIDLTDLTPTAPAVTVTVEDGDNIWDLSVARHEEVGVPASPSVIAEYVAEVAAVNAAEIEDPNLIYTGQQLILPPIGTPPTPSSHAEGAGEPAPELEDMELEIHVIQPGDTLWDVLEDFHGHVDAEMIRHVAVLNELEDPSNIPVGTAVIIAWRPLGPPPQEVVPDAQTPPAPPTEAPVPVSPEANGSQVPSDASPPATTSRGRVPRRRLRPQRGRIDQSRRRTTDRQRRRRHM